MNGSSRSVGGVLQPHQGLGGLSIVFLLLFQSAALAQTLPATAPGSRIDPELWVRRNIDAIASMPRNVPLQEGVSVPSALSLCLMINPVLWNDQYVPRLLEVVDSAIAQQKEPAAIDMLKQKAALLRLPQSERQMRLLMRTSDVSAPIISAANQYNVISALGNAPGNELFDSLSRQYVPELDEAARAAGQWQGLILSYYRLAIDAGRRGRPDLVRAYTDRMIPLLRAHPEFQDANRGNTEGADPARIAALLMDLDRRRDLESLTADAAMPVKLNWLVGTVAALVQRGQVEDARRIIEGQLKDVSTQAAERLGASLRGDIVPLPAQAPVTQPTRGGRAPRATVDAAELRMRAALRTIAEYHAKQGNLRAASRQLVIVGASSMFGGTPNQSELRSWEWARLGVLAHEGKLEGTASDAFDQALAALAGEPAGTFPNQKQEKAGFVRELVALGDFDYAARVLGSSARISPGDRAHLASILIDRGDVARARNILSQALEQARQNRGSEGISMIAVELNLIGERQLAETTLLESLNHSNSEDFGMGSSGGLVQAAVKMNRLDLIETAYQRGDPFQKVLISAFASVYGAYWDQMER